MVLFALKKAVLIRKLARAEEKAQKAFIRAEKEKELNRIRSMIKSQNVSAMQARRAKKNIINLKKVSKGLGIGFKAAVKTAKLLDKLANQQNKRQVKRRKR